MVNSAVPKPGEEVNAMTLDGRSAAMALIRERFMHGALVSGGVRDGILSSWERC
ncbi:hypothetical protein ACIGCZ_38680 [Streptomyces nigra]|uniref:hypothetical protein n=1 Tax=Streptomyces nigra TaxID=1827580 RepID=UPI0037CCE4E4